VVEYLHPRGVVDGSDLVTVLRDRATAGVEPFDDRIIAFLDALSRRLFRISRAEPAIAPLAFFLRRANLVALVEKTRRRIPDGAIVVPQGTVFHVPPTNVDTLFLYTLAISMLTGNANIVRISPNAGPGTARVLNLLLEAIDEEPLLGDRLTIVRFGRDEAALDACSRHADVRMIWGGDSAIRSIRRSALEPSAKDLTFPDRISIAAIEAEAWLGSSDSERDVLAHGLYNDVYWFDQMACSSPAQLIVVGDDQRAHAAERDISERLDRVAAVRYENVDGQAINKMVALVAGAESGLGRFAWLSNSLVTVEAQDVATAVQFRPGGGFLSTQRVDALAVVVPQLTRRVQTLSTFGFDRDTLTDFARAADGNGVDRIVPIGSALDFDAVWDGKDLILESLRLVTIA
jgi:hypothetical protein